MAQHDIGLVGLAVMGQNLVLNMANHGFSVGVQNRTTSVTDKFVGSLKEQPADVVHEGTTERIAGYQTLEELVQNLKRPRKVMLMVKAGPAVDALIGQLLPMLEVGDIIIDGGNTNFADTNRRTQEVEEKGLLYVGTGVSGGEDGALRGPSIMPGGSEAAWPEVKEILQAISAKVGPDDSAPCCEWVGPAGAGHYVKMVHNGIEYGDMQLICESYFLLQQALGLSNDELYRVFADWNESELESYLIEITRDIFTVPDPEGDGELVDKVLDTAKQKGTGKWMSQHALDLGIPLTLVTEAVFARCLSAQKEGRTRASKILTGPTEPFSGDRDQFIEDVRQALYASKLVSYAQGFVQLDAAAEEFDWNLNNGNIALLWRGGCIIRSRFLGDIKDAFDDNPELENLLLDDFFRKSIEAAQPSWRRVIAQGVALGIPMPGFTSALSYYDGYRRARLPANLLQAQRDYFGAHTYQRIDREGVLHTDWLHERRLT